MVNPEHLGFRFELEDIFASDTLDLIKFTLPEKAKKLGSVDGQIGTSHLVISLASCPSVASVLERLGTSQTKIENVYKSIFKGRRKNGRSSPKEISSCLEKTIEGLVFRRKWSGNNESKKVKPLDLFREIVQVGSSTGFGLLMSLKINRDGLLEEIKRQEDYGAAMVEAEKILGHTV